MRYRSTDFLFILVLLLAAFHPPLFADIEDEIQQQIDKVYNLSADDSKATLVKIDTIRSQYQDSLTPEHRAQLIGMEAIYHTYSNEYQLALDTIEKINQLPKPQVNSFDWRIHTVKGYIYWHMGEGQQALQHYLQSYEKVKDQALYEYERVATEIMIGQASMELGFYREALPYFERVVEHTQEKGSLRQLAMAYNFLGETMFKLEQIDKAFDYHQKALKIRLEQNMRFHSALSYHSLGSIHHHRREYGQAQRHFLKAITIRRENGDHLGVLYSQLALAKVHMVTEQKQDLTALLSTIIDNAKAQEKFAPMAEAYRLQSEFFESQSQYSQALAAFKQYQQTLEKVELKKTSSHLAKYITKSTTVAKDINILELQKINEIKNLEVINQQQKAFIIVVAAAIIITVLMLFLWLLQKKRHKIQNINRHLSDTLNDLKATQGKLIESEKMSAMTTLVAGMAHQLNTPIGVGVTTISVIEDKVEQFSQNIKQGGITRGALNQLLEDVSEATRLALSTMNKTANLVAQFKLISAHLEGATPEQFELHELLTHHTDLLTGQMTDRKPDIRIHGAKVQLLSYPSAIGKVLYHLINNSVEHGFNDSEPAVIDIEIKTLNQAVAIRYQDNGKGIDKDKLSKIFDPFYTGQLGSGSIGLGLSIVHNLVVQLMQGSVTVESSGNQGTMFNIQLPLELQLTSSDIGNVDEYSSASSF